MQKPKSQQPYDLTLLLLVFVITPIILTIFHLPTSEAKSVFEPCKAADSCPSLLSYILPWDSELSEIAFRFQVDISPLLGSNSIDPTRPWQENQILPINTVIKVPVLCSCVSGIRQAPVVYTIRASDTLDSISKGFGGLVSTEQIRSVNSKISRFINGRKILVPLPCTCFNNTINGLAAVYMSYVVQRGERLSTVAAKYGSTANELEGVNGLGQPNVDAGDVIAVPLPACSSANLKWRNETLILANNSYAVRANDCIMCRCGPSDLNLDCSTSGIGPSCSHLQCKGSNLFIGQADETPTELGCDVTKCVYRGYYRGKISRSLVKKSHVQCSGGNHSGIAISPLKAPMMRNPIVSSTNLAGPSPSPRPSSVATGTSNSGAQQDSKHYYSSSTAGSYSYRPLAPLLVFLVIKPILI